MQLCSSFGHLLSETLVHLREKHIHSQSVGRSVGQSVSRSVGQSVSRSVGQSVSRSVGRSVSRSVGQSVSRSVGQSISQSVSKSDNQSIKEGSIMNACNNASSCKLIRNHCFACFNFLSSLSFVREALL